MKLEEEIKKYETVNRTNCTSCGNPWFFDYPNGYKCTTCAYFEKRENINEKERA